MADTKYGVELVGKDNLSSTINTVKKELDDLGKTATSSLDSFSKKFESISNSTAPLKRQLRDLQALMAEMQFKGLNNTAEFQAIAQYAGKVKDALTDASTAAKRFADDTFALKAVTDGMQAVAGAATIATGAMGLFGVKNEEVKNAILKVQSAMAILNGIQAIANKLNKDSALMWGLKELRLKLTTTATAENTLAENANTASTVANKAATQAAAAAEAKDVVAKGAQTAATKAATKAQIAHNLAVLSNPYVIAAAAVVALTGVLVALAVSANEATEEELSLQAATEAMAEQMDTATKSGGEQIAAYMELKRTYEECGGNVDEIKKKIIQNTEKQRQAQIQVTNLDQATRMFSSEGTSAFIKGCNARVMAIAAEAAASATYIKVLSKLNEALTKVGSGQEVNYSDVVGILKELGLAEKTIQSILSGAGYKEAFRAFSKNDLQLKDGVDPTKAQQEVITKAFQYAYDNGVFAQLNKLAEKWKKDAAASSAPIADLLTDGGSGGNGGNGNGSGGSGGRGGRGGHSSRQKAAQQTHKDQQKTIDLTKGENAELLKTLNTLDGCNTIIREADKQMSSLDRTSADYAEKMKTLKNVKLSASLQKLNFIDKTTLSGLMEYKKTVKSIIEDLPDDSPQIANLNKQLTEANTKIEEIYRKRIDSGKKEDLEDLAKYYKELIPTLKHLSDEQVSALRKLKEVEDQLNKIAQEENNAKLGIATNSVAYYEQQYQEALKAYQDFLNNEDLSIVCQMSMEIQEDGTLLESIREQLKNAVDEAAADLGNARALKKAADILVRPTKQGNTLDFGDLFDYKNSKLDIINRQFDETLAKIEELNQIKLEDVGEDAFNEAQKSLDAYNRKLADLRKAYRNTQISEDIKEYVKTLTTQGIDGTKSFVSGLNSMYQAFDGLGQKLDDAKNEWEAFMAVFDAIFTVIDGIKSTYDTITGLLETLKLLKGAKEADAAATNAQTAANLGEAGSEITDAAAKGANASGEAMKQSSKMGPFGWIAGIAAAIAVAAAIFGIISQAKGFASGGVIGGSSYSGDKLIARVNSGEMILNGRQQKNLFNAIDKNRLGYNGGEQSLTFKIKGSDLYGTLKNYSNIKAKSGIKTGIR